MTAQGLPQQNPPAAGQQWPRSSQRWPYHEYVHQVSAAGWDNLTRLDQYMSTGKSLSNGVDTVKGHPTSSNHLVISVLDITHDFQKLVWPEIRDERALREFFVASEQGRECDRSKAKVRLFIGEYSKIPSPELIEIFGAALGLDPRFWSWAIHAKDRVSMPSDRSRVPYLKVGFAVLREVRRQNATDADKVGAMIYVVPDEQGDGWTGLILFDSHMTLRMSVSNLHNPPAFKAHVRPRDPCDRQSFRELYLETFDFISLESATNSPFYAIHALLRLNNFLWMNIIMAIREADRRANGISSVSIGHGEEISSCRKVVQRGGSLAWKGADDPGTIDKKQQLEEDFNYLTEETDLLWQNRSKMTQIRQRRTEARWTSLTNAFTYLFAPVTIMTGIWGMNVSQLTGSSSNPSIWQPFVAVIVMNVVVVIVLAIWGWVQDFEHRGRRSGLKEVLGFALGGMSWGEGEAGAT